METRIPDHAAILIVEAIDPGIKVLSSKFGQTLGWSLEDFRQEAFVKVCEPSEIRDFETIVAYYATVYKNHIYSLVRKLQTQARTHGKLKDAQEGLPSFYDDSKIMELSYCIKTQFSSSFQEVVTLLLEGKTHRQIMKSVPEVKNNASFYKAMEKIRSVVKDFYVLD